MKLTKKITLGLLVASAGLSHASLVAHYTFDETSGQTAADSAGPPQNLTTTNGGVAWSASGRIGGAVDLTADVMLGADAIGDGNNFTISMWINEASGQSGYRGIYTTGTDTVAAVGGGTTSGGGTDNWGINVEASRRGDLRVNNVAAGASQGIDTPETAAQGAWNLLTLTYFGDGTTATANGYLNGSLVGTTTHLTNANLELQYSAGAQLWQLGTDRNNNGRRFTGLVDDLAIWDEVLTDTQIQNIYQGGLLGIDAPTSIPEPTSAVLALVAGLFGLGRRRR